MKFIHLKTKSRNLLFPNFFWWSSKTFQEGGLHFVDLGPVVVRSRAGENGFWKKGTKFVHFSRVTDNALR